MPDLTWWCWTLMVLGYLGACSLFLLAMYGRRDPEPHAPDEHRTEAI